jgi:hypothetical protein
MTRLTMGRVMRTSASRASETALAFGRLPASATALALAMLVRSNR